MSDSTNGSEPEIIDLRALELALPEPFTGRPVELIPRPVGCDASVNHLMAALEAEAEAGAPGGELLLGSVGKTMALYLACRHATRPLVLPARKLGLSRDRLSRVLEYIQAHVAGDLTLDGLAGVAAAVGFCDQSQFTTTFRRATGVTPGVWRRECAGN